MTKRFFENSISGFEEGERSKPLVSVIIPTYNRALYIEESINSVLTQTYSKLEVIIIDDGSTDDTEKIIKRICDSRLRYIYQNNRGRSNARNHGLGLSRGQFITFLDSDDLYLPRKVEMQVNYLLSQPRVGMVYTSAYCINSSGELLNSKYEATVSGLIYSQIAFYKPVTITLPTVMVRRSVFNLAGDFDEKMDRFEDTDMWRRISKRYQIDAIPDYTCKLRTHSNNSLLNQSPELIFSALNYYVKKIMNEDEDVNIEVRRKGISRLYRYYGRALMSLPSLSREGEILFKIASNYDPAPLTFIDSSRTFFNSFYYKIRFLLKQILQNK